MHSPTGSDRPPATAGSLPGDGRFAGAAERPGAEFARSRVLAIGVERTLVDALSTRLRASGYLYEFFTSAYGAAEYARTHSPRLAIVNHELSDVDVRSFCSDLRAMSPRISIVVVAQGASSASVASWLDLGVDDCVGGSDVLPELMARARRVLHVRDETPVAARSAPVRFGSLVLDTDGRQALVDGRPVALSPLEFDLLQCLVRRAGCPVSVDDLLEEAWGERRKGADVPRKVFVAVSKVRRALGRVTTEVSIERVRDNSYRLS